MTEYPSRNLHGFETCRRQETSLGTIFQQIKFKGGGPGLGLAIVKGIIEAHGGQIWVESAGYDEQTCPGSAFHIRLPKTRPQPEQ